MPKQLHGVLGILQTPFTERDTICPDDLRREIDHGFAAGIDGVGTGMVSELLRLSADERRELTRMAVEFTAGRGSVFAGVGSESTKQTIALACDAERLGCDAVMAPPPTTVRLGGDALTKHYMALADAISLPVIVQDASGYVGQSIPMGVYLALLDRYGNEKIVFKPEAQPIGPSVSVLRDATAGRARIFDGSGGIHLVDCHRRGIAGTMPGMEMIAAQVFIWKALARGDNAAAYRAYLPVCAMVAIQIQAGLDGFLAVEKYLLKKHGIFQSDRRREPLGWTLDRETIQEIDRLDDLVQAAIAQATPEIIVTASPMDCVQRGIT